MAQSPSSEIQKPEVPQQSQPDQSPASADDTKQPSDVAHPAPAASPQVISEERPAAHPKAESKEDRSEFWTAKLTDWLLAAFTLALVVFTRRLYKATAGLFQETAGLRTAADQQAKDMKASVDAAQASAKAAERSADIAERGLIDRERAFVFVKEIDMFTERGDAVHVGRTKIGGEVKFYRLSAVLENSGETPAVRLMYNFNCGLITAQNLATFDFPDQGPPRHAVLGPRATLQTAVQTLSAANMQQIAAGVDRWFIWGWADYDDIFERTGRHRTEFCFEVDARKLPDGQIFIGFPMHERFNATDKDCLRQPQPYQPA